MPVQSLNFEGTLLDTVVTRFFFPQRYFHAMMRQIISLEEQTRDLIRLSISLISHMASCTLWCHKSDPREIQTFLQSIYFLRWKVTIPTSAQSSEWGSRPAEQSCQSTLSWKSRIQSSSKCLQHGKFPKIDLFTMEWNAKCQLFCSRADFEDEGKGDRAVYNPYLMPSWYYGWIGPVVPYSLITLTCES